MQEMGKSSDEFFLRIWVEIRGPKLETSPICQDNLGSKHPEVCRSEMGNLDKIHPEGNAPSRGGRRRFESWQHSGMHQDGQVQGAGSHSLLPLCLRSHFRGERHCRYPGMNGKAITSYGVVSPIRDCFVVSPLVML